MQITPKKKPPRVSQVFAEDKDKRPPPPKQKKAPFRPLKEYIDPKYKEMEDSSEDEGMPDYKIGGYHPVHVGEIF